MTIPTTLWNFRHQPRVSRFVGVAMLFFVWRVALWLVAGASLWYNSEL
jgi:hypothetical protein